MTEAGRRRVASSAAGEGGSSDVPQHSDSGLNLFSLMEDINDRLKLLNYEQLFLRANLTLMLKPLNRLYFALPLAASEQFPYFSNLTAWLLNLCHRDTVTWGEFDDPNTISAAIAEEVRRMGCPHEVRREGLRQGWGEAVLLVLDLAHTASAGGQWLHRHGASVRHGQRGRRSSRQREEAGRER